MAGYWPGCTDIGANASAEGGDDEGAEDQAQTVIDVVHSFRLNETSFDKKSYLTHLKCKFAGSAAIQSFSDFPSMKQVKEGLKKKGASDEEVKDFETKAGAYAKKIIANFKDYEFLIGESMDPDGM
jgi:hypothetical protein